MLRSSGYNQPVSNTDEELTMIFSSYFIFSFFGLIRLEHASHENRLAQGHIYYIIQYVVTFNKSVNLKMLPGMAFLGAIILNSIVSILIFNYS